MDLQSIAIAAMRHPPWGENCWRKELNPQPSDYKSGALPIELLQQIGDVFIPNISFLNQHLPFQDLHLFFGERANLLPFCRGFF